MKPGATGLISSAPDGAEAFTSGAPAPDSSAPGAETERRNDGLDLLRGVAVLLVFFHHNYKIRGARGADVLDSFALLGQSVGWVGVDLFFVLSGFLIGTLLLREVRQRGGLRILRFLIRRMFKIWPSYYFLLLVSFLLVLNAEQSSDLLIRVSKSLVEFKVDYLPNIFHFQNYTKTPILHTWTLAVEEHFYLILPLMIAACFAVGQRLLPFGRRHWPFLALCVTGVVLENALRLWTVSASSKKAILDTVYRATHFRFDSLLFGCLMAALVLWEPTWVAKLRRWKWVVVAAAVGATLLPAVLSQPQIRQFGYTALYLAFGPLIVVVHASGADGRLQRWKDNRLLKAVAYLGTLSYTFYLWHYHPFVFQSLDWIRRFFPDVKTNASQALLWIVSMSLYFALSFVSAWVCTVAVERPFLALRTRWFPSRPDVRPAAAGTALG